MDNVRQDNLKALADLGAKIATEKVVELKQFARLLVDRYNNIEKYWEVFKPRMSQLKQAEESPES